MSGGGVRRRRPAAASGSTGYTGTPPSRGSACTGKPGRRLRHGRPWSPRDRRRRRRCPAPRYCWRPGRGSRVQLPAGYRSPDQKRAGPTTGKISRLIEQISGFALFKPRGRAVQAVGRLACELAGTPVSPPRQGQQAGVVFIRLAVFRRLCPIGPDFVFALLRAHVRQASRVAAARRYRVRPGAGFRGRGTGDRAARHAQGTGPRQQCDHGGARGAPVSPRAGVRHGRGRRSRDRAGSPTRRNLMPPSSTVQSPYAWLERSSKRSRLKWVFPSEVKVRVRRPWTPAVLSPPARVTPTASEQRPREIHHGRYGHGAARARRQTGRVEADDMVGTAGRRGPGGFHRRDRVPPAAALASLLRQINPCRGPGVGRDLSRTRLHRHGRGPLPAC